MYENSFTGEEIKAQCVSWMRNTHPLGPQRWKSMKPTKQQNPADEIRTLSSLTSHRVLLRKNMFFQRLKFQSTRLMKGPHGKKEKKIIKKRRENITSLTLISTRLYFKNHETRYI